MSPRRSKAAAPTLFPVGPPEEKTLELPPRTRFCRVALDRPVRHTFTYLVPPGVEPAAAVGCRVAVPFGRGREIGVIVAVEEETDVAVKRLRPIQEVLDVEPSIQADLLGLTEWIAHRYAASWGECLAAVLPALLKREQATRKVSMVRAADGVGAEELREIETRFPKQHRLLRTLVDMGGAVEAREILAQLNLSDSPLRTLARRGWVEIERVDARPDGLDGPVQKRERPRELSREQAQAVATLEGRLEERRHGVFLLEGVTGSGKTEVYLRAIEQALALGRSAIVLVPEIALTPQTVSWFRSRFEGVAVLHSRMTDSQRLEMWMRLERGEARVVVGARSAIFAPLEDLGVIVVDEEHEPSFKQNNSPRYHARDVAVERARRVGAVCVLGSATPSLESWEMARQGRYEHLLLPKRVGGGSIASVDVVDLRAEHEKQKGVPIFSRLLVHLLGETLDSKEQAILFLNRRGFIPVLWCPGCEKTVRCAQCDVSLTLHRRIKRLVCHACCEEALLPEVCPTCTRPGLRFLGMGAERVESELRKLLPEARVARMDSDTMRRREDYEDVLERFGKGEIDVLVGTQMIAKGLDFPRVTLVGIVSADSSLHLPDFRASERTFQLIAQVAGRAGRSHLPGRIVVQTMAPLDPAVRLASERKFEEFARTEAQQRKELGYPPYGRLLRVVFEDPDEARATRSAEALAQKLEELPDTVLLGPAPAPIAQLRTRFRQHLLVKAGLESTSFQRAVEIAHDFAPTQGKTRVVVDVDPMSML